MSWSAWTKEASWKLGKVASSLWEIDWLRSSLSQYWEVTTRRYTAFGTRVAQEVEVKAVERAKQNESERYKGASRDSSSPAKFYL